MNPFKALFASRKFWLLIMDTIVSLVLYFVPRYVPGAEADVRFLILALQPIFIVVISAIAYEDGKIIPAQLSVEEAKEYNAAYKAEKDKPPVA